MNLCPVGAPKPCPPPIGFPPRPKEAAANLMDAQHRACSVLVVEDDDFARKYIRITLQKAGFEVLEAASGEEALELFDKQPPKVVLLDLGLPGIDGFEVCQMMRQQREDLAILILTGRSDDSDKVSGLDLGADDYLVKPFGPDVLLARINAVLRRCFRQHQAADVLTLLDLRLEFHTMKVFKGDRLIDLTKREFSLLATFLKHPGEVLSREKLREAVWGENHFGSAKALDVFVCKLREKLEDDPAHPKYVKTAWGVGFVCG